MNFNGQPHLEDDLIILKPLKEEDFEALYAAASDPLVWEQHPMKERYKRDVFLENFFKTAIESKGAFLVLDKKTGTAIGSSRFYNLHEKESDVEIGWTFLARPYWGGKYNRAMKALMMNHAFQYVDNIIFRIGENNMRSRKACEKIGGVLIDPADNPHLECLPNNVIYKIQKR
jgi:RimJ/RimL family protein N-acetyltransferase